jgi:Spy/CpxP family protein refolding chaperone
MKTQFVTIALTTFLGLGTVGAVLAAPQQDQQAPAPVQGRGHRPVDPNRQVKMLSKRLNLTADQQNQILPILSDRQQQIAGIQADNSLSPQDRHAKMRAIREDSDAKIRALLNDNQKQTYDQMLQQQRERMQQRHDQHQNGAQNPAAIR